MALVYVHCPECRREIQEVSWEAQYTITGIHSSDPVSRVQGKMVDTR
jgi:hypothetical protein